MNAQIATDDDNDDVCDGDGDGDVDGDGDFLKASLLSIQSNQTVQSYLQRYSYCRSIAHPRRERRPWTMRQSSNG